jgi:hypothetical protein
MSAQTEPRNGLTYGFTTLGETPWKTEIEASLLKIGLVGLHLSVIDRDLTAPPGGESEGDTYLVGAGATGDWSGQVGKAAIYFDGAYVFYTPREGWRAWIEDEGRLIAYTSGAWTTGLSLAEIAHADQAAVTLGNADNDIGGLTVSDPPTQAEVVALRDKCEELADDVRALSTLLHQIRTDLIAAGRIKGSA